MLGIWALGERALGQLIGRTTATLLVSQGSFSLAGQSVTVKGPLANAVFAVDGWTSGFSGGTYNQSLLRTGLTPGSLAATIAGSATNSLWAITPAGEPGRSNATTNYSGVLKVTARKRHALT